MGSINAVFNLGLCYEDGEGVSQDKKKAFKLYQEAAAFGNTSARHALERLNYTNRWTIPKVTTHHPFSS